tara:strand:+ start:16 stop:435 length:420 start_codon:yes stop_codon:yes gene_type:complete
MSESENASNNIIQGPWKKTKKVKIPENRISDIQEEIAFIEELSESAIVQMVYTLGDNGVDIGTKDFFQNIAFIVESLKCTLYEEKGWFHPLTPIIKNITEVSVEDSDSDEETITLKLNIDKLNTLVKKLNLASDDPEIE